MTEDAFSDEAVAANRRALLEILLAEEGLEQTSAPSVPRRPPTDEPVLSYAQERLWFLEQFESDTSALSIRGAIRLEGPLDVDVLRRSLDTILQRHESIRTLIVNDDGRPRPLMVDAPEMPFAVDDLRSHGAESRRDELDRILVHEAARTFDLEHELPIFVRLVRLGDEEQVISVTMHHVASDGSSFGLFFKELGALYEAYSAGRGSPLPELEAQYYDYAAWQRDWVGSEAVRGQLDYWTEQLGGELPVCELPTDFARPPKQTFDGAQIEHELATDLTMGLRELSKRCGATMFMTLLTAFKVVIARRTGHHDVIIGTPVAGRVRPQLELMIGMFLNTLVLRTDLGDRPRFSKLVERVRDVSLGAFDHQDVPFELLLGALNPVRDVSRSPLFQVFFNMMNFDVELSGLPGVRHEVVSQPDVGAKFDLTLYVGERDGGLTLLLVYNRKLYRADTMRQFLEQFVSLLEAVVADPERRIDEYPLVTREASAVLPDPTAPLDAAWHGSVGSALARHAARTPGHLAVADKAERWTYGQLASASNRLARWLRDEGVGRGDVVAIYGHRSASLVWAVTGALSAGAAYLIVDPSYPPARVCEYLRLAEPAAWLEVAAAGAPASEVGDCLDELGVTSRLALPGRSGIEHMASLVAVSDEPMDDGVGPDDLACLTFTSGSTGVPKAVMGRHGSLTHFLPWMSAEFGVSGDDRFCMLSGLAHDPIQRDMFWPLWSGATIVVPDPDELVNPGWLFAWLREQEVTVAHLTPATGQLIAEGPGGSDEPVAPIPSLRLALFIGDVLTRRDVERLGRLAPNLQVVNLYGATETQRASGFHVVGRADRPGVPTDEARAREVVPLGTGMPGVQLLIRAATGAPAGFGEVGEIWMRSPHLALGYLGRPEDTEARFLVNPATGLAGDRLYRTGDLGRYRSDGTVEFGGRNDRQVQLRGFRIELDEIRARLGRHDLVRDSVVLLQDIGGERQLVAYVVPANGSVPSGAELGRFLRTQLPSHMVPSQFVPVGAIPLTPNGKLDRAALPAFAPPPAADGSGAARDSLERMLVGLWEQVLNRSPVGIHDNFFDLGGYSLLATRLFALIEKATGERIPVAALFETPTIAELADLIRNEGWATTWSSLVPVQPGGTGRPFFYVAPYMISVLQFAHLATELGPEQPLYGLQPQGLDGVLPVHERVEDMAAHYIKEMKSLQPEGPYTIGGHCSGSWVAFEMARQLEANGDELAAVVMVDQGPPGVERPVIKPLPYILNRLRFYFRDGRLRSALSWQLRIGVGRYLLRRVGPSNARYSEEVRAKHRAAFQVYEGGSIKHDLVLLRSEESISLEDKEWYLHWRDKTGGSFRHETLIGTHANLLEQPYVVDLANKLRTALGIDSPSDRAIA